MTTHARPDVGIIGGTGFYSLLEEVDEIRVDTPYGPPSAPVMVGEVNGRAVAFLARHGTEHSFPPHKINYRANLWALRAVGVRQILAPCAVGSLVPALGPGSLVVPDQVVDRTSGRQQTYFDSGAVHVSFADPYCPVGRETVLKTAHAVLHLHRPGNRPGRRPGPRRRGSAAGRFQSLRREHRPATNPPAPGGRCATSDALVPVRLDPERHPTSV